MADKPIIRLPLYKKESETDREERNKGREMCHKKTRIAHPPPGLKKHREDGKLAKCKEQLCFTPKLDGRKFILIFIEGKLAVSQRVLLPHVQRNRNDLSSSFLHLICGYYKIP